MYAKNRSVAALKKPYEALKARLHLLSLVRSVKYFCALGFTLISTYSDAQAQKVLPQESKQQIFEQHFKNWYQVEVIIFERKQELSPEAESWPTNLSLSYPPRIQLLGSGNQEENSELAGDTYALAPEDSANSLPDSPEEQFRQSLEQPFIPLDSQLRTMNNEANRLQRRSAMRVLFHETWRQPMVDKNNAAAIVMSAGDTFGENSELEGSITLHISRYLHIDTNLWLTKFEANFGQENEHWPILPRRPILLSYQEQEGDTNELALADIQENTDDSLDEQNNWNIAFNKNTALASNDSISGDLLGDYSSIAQQPYVVKQLVTMRQKRRMRSGELHYLDHPRLGLLIRIDKYNPRLP